MNENQLEYEALREKWHFTYRAAKAAFCAYAAVKPHDQGLFQNALEAAYAHSDARLALISHLEANGPQTPT